MVAEGTSASDILRPRLKLAGQMSGIPLHERRTQALPQLVNGSLGYQHHRQMTIADIQVERSCTAPAQRLIEPD